MTYKKSEPEKILVINDGKHLSTIVKGIFVPRAHKEEYKIIHVADHKKALEKIIEGEEILLIIFRIKNGKGAARVFIEDLIKENKKYHLVFVSDKEKDSEIVYEYKRGYKGHISFYELPLGILEIQKLHRYTNKLKTAKDKRNEKHKP